LLTTAMKSVGEAMSIGRSFPESLQKALCSMETGLNGLSDVAIEGYVPGDGDKSAILAALSKPTPDRLLVIAQAFREGLSLEESYFVPPYSGEGRYIYQGILVGGGFSQRIGMYNSVSFTVLWNVNELSISPYSNPVFRVGFNTFF
jgi:hypothetical protein